MTLTINRNKTTQLEKTRKFDLATMNWEGWTKDIELALTPQKVNELAFDETIENLHKVIEESIQKATYENCSRKTVTSHSKPYWTKELSAKSTTLRESLGVYLTRNTDGAFQRYQAAKEDFEETRKHACQQFIMNKTRNLNTAEAVRFWKEFNRLFKPASDQRIEAIVREDGSVITDNQELEEELFSTFFKAKHIESNSSHFNQDFYDDTNQCYSEILESDFQPHLDSMANFQLSSRLYNPVTPLEVLSIIKDSRPTAGSFDNCEVHPTMLKHLGPYAIQALSTLFSLCLRNGKWLWNASSIMFLKKEGKKTYSNPGSYRPISISSYIGKVFERVLAGRLETYLISIGLIDENQEGFSKGRNTVRYLHRLTSGIKGDIMKKLTVLCLFIDFEKAFDSVWKKGLIVKLWKVGVHGCYLSTINRFLFGRTVSLLINGFIGPVRSCLDYGLPQGSVLSPILFKFYVFDIELLCMAYEQIKVFKFADDGTVKVTGKDLEECLFYLDIALSTIGEWTSQWRMVINCDINKTEIICFNSTDPTQVPQSYTICGKVIHLTASSKVLGVTLDSKLGFKQHSQELYNKLLYRWICISKYTNRNWGMNKKVLVRLARTVMFSSLFYASLVWQNSANMVELNKLWYKVSKSAVGAVFNVQGSILEVILGIPPLDVANRVFTTKHYLKVLGSREGETHREFILNEIRSGNTVITSQMRDVLKYLKWRATLQPNSFSIPDDLCKLFELPKKICHYTKSSMNYFTELMWQESIINKLQLEGWPFIPKVSVSPLPIPPFTSRETEVLVMSLFYKNNLLNSFLYNINRYTPSPLCSCGIEEQTTTHLLTNCDQVEVSLRDEAMFQLNLCNNSANLGELGTVAALNCSRDPGFIRVCRDIVESEGLNLRTKICL